MSISEFPSFCNETLHKIYITGFLDNLFFKGTKEIQITKNMSPLLQLNLNHRVTGSIRDQLYFPPLPSLLRAAGGDSRCRGGRAAAHH